MSASGGLWAGGSVLKNPATQRAVVESKLAQCDDDVDDYDDFPDDPVADRHSGAARQWIDSPGKALLYGDRPPLRPAPAPCRPAQQLSLWEREERERQAFLFKAHMGSGAAKTSSAPLTSKSGRAKRRGRALAEGNGRPASEEEIDDAYDIGLLWLIRNHKMIVSGFAPGSLASERDVRKGDILRSVDGVEVLGFKQHEDGSHEAEELLLGELGSTCALALLRPQEPDAQGTVALQELRVELPRCLALE